MAIQAANDTYGIQDRMIETEVDELTNVLVSIANTRDSGQSIFAATKLTPSKSILMAKSHTG